MTDRLGSMVSFCKSSLAESWQAHVKAGRVLTVNRDSSGLLHSNVQACRVCMGLKRSGLFRGRACCLRFSSQARRGANWSDLAALLHPFLGNALDYLSGKADEDCLRGLRRF